MFNPVIWVSCVIKMIFLMFEYNYCYLFFLIDCFTKTINKAHDFFFFFDWGPITLILICLYGSPNNHLARRSNKSVKHYISLCCSFSILWAALFRGLHTSAALSPPSSVMNPLQCPPPFHVAAPCQHPFSWSTLSPAHAEPFCLLTLSPNCSTWAVPLTY